MSDVVARRQAAVARCFGANFELIYERTGSVAGQPKATPLLGKREEMSRIGSKWWKRSHYTNDFQTGARLSESSRIDWVVDRLNLRLEGATTAVISDYRDDGNFTRNLVFTRNIGVDLSSFVFSDLDSPPETKDTYHFDNFPYFDTGLLAPDRGYVIKATKFTVMGEQCLMIESAGYDQMIVCPAYDYSIVSRKLNWTPGGPKRIEIQNESFSNFGDTCWLPQRQTATEYPFPGDHEGLNVEEPLHYSIYSLNKFTNDLNAIQFDQPSVSAGTTIVNNLTNEVYKASVGNAKEPFLLEITEAAELLAVNTRGSYRHIGVLLLGFIGLAVFFRYFIGRKRSFKELI